MMVMIKRLLRKRSQWRIRFEQSDRNVTPLLAHRRLLGILPSYTSDGPQLALMFALSVLQTSYRTFSITTARQHTQLSQ
jgi:hypothetical protein